MSDVLKFIFEDAIHFIGVLVLLWMLFAGVEAWIRAWRGKQ